MAARPRIVTENGRRSTLTIIGYCALLCATSLIANLSFADDVILSLSPTENVVPNVPASFFDDLLLEQKESEEEEDAKRKLSVEERLKKLEQKHLVLENNYDELNDQYIALKRDIKNDAESGHDDATMSVNGRINIDYWTFPESSPAINVFENNDPAISPQDRIEFRRLRFGVKGDLWKTMIYKIEMEFADGEDIEFRDAFFGWEDLPNMDALIIGNQKRPYGLDYLNSSLYNVFMERPFIVESFNQDARRLGIQSYNVSDDLSWNWRYGLFMQELIQSDGDYIGDNFQGEAAGRLANTFWYDKASGGRGYGHWAISGSTAYPDGNAAPGEAPNTACFRSRPEARSTNRWIDTGCIDGADHYGLLGLENVWNFGPLQLVGEYQNVWLQRNGGSDLQFDGAYAYISYFLTGEHMPWNRSLGVLGRIKPIENFFLVDTCCDGVRGGWGAWQIAYRWSHADLNDDDILGGVGNSHTLGLNWYWNAYSRLQFNAIYGEIDDHEGFDDADPPNSLGPLSGHYTILGMRLMVDF